MGRACIGESKVGLTGPFSGAGVVRLMIIDSPWFDGADGVSTGCKRPLTSAHPPLGFPAVDRSRDVCGGLGRCPACSCLAIAGQAGSGKTRKWDVRRIHIEVKRKKVKDQN